MLLFKIIRWKSLSATFVGSDKGDHSQCPVDIMSSLTSLSSAGQCQSETSASLDKKHKKKSWVRHSVTLRYSVQFSGLMLPL